MLNNNEDKDHRHKVMVLFFSQQHCKIYKNKSKIFVSNTIRIGNYYVKNEL